jgi:hypothetical protein
MRFQVSVVEVRRYPDQLWGLNTRPASPADLAQWDCATHIDIWRGSAEAEVTVREIA